MKKTPWGTAETFIAQGKQLKNIEVYHHAVYKDYAGQKRKLVMLKGLPGRRFIKSKTTKKETINTEKLDNHITRAKEKILEYGLCNDWELFVTLTINPDKHDRTDLKTYYSKFSRFLRYQREKYGLDIKYLFIPELHKDKKNWHMHGFISGLPLTHLKKQQTNNYFTWPEYQQKFGFISIDLLRDREKASRYITKYITKEMAFSVTQRNAKLYYCSRGLKTAQILCSGAFKDSAPNQKEDYENEWAVIRWFYPGEFPKIEQDFF